MWLRSHTQACALWNHTHEARHVLFRPASRCYSRRRASIAWRMADKKKASVLDMSKYVDQSVRIKFMGGREVVGVLKGYDALLNLVLDDCKEFLKDPDDPYRLLDETRSLGLIVCRGTSVMLVCPTDGFEEIANPFLQDEGGEE